MARGVDKGYRSAVAVDGIRTDMLGNAACLTLGDGAVPYCVEQRGLTMST